MLMLPSVLQHLLRICMPTKASVSFQTLHHPTPSTCRNVLRLVTDIQIISYL
jgi:hypothetical protein